MAFLTEAPAFFARLPCKVIWKADPGLLLQAPGPDEETAIIRHAGEKRRREFRSGRNLARAVLQAIGQPTRVLPSGPDRSPQWPDGVQGSISHCDDLALVVAARGLVGIGVDIEQAIPLPCEMLWLILTGADIDLTPPDITQWPNRVFCAKEALYKAISQQIRFIPDFDEAAIRPVGTDGFRVIPLSDRLRATRLAEHVQGWHGLLGRHHLAIAILPAAGAGGFGGAT